MTAFSSGAPIVLLCLARPELLERRPEWAVPGPDRIGLPLEPLSEDEAHHFRSDNEAGLVLGKKVAKAAILRYLTRADVRR